MPRLVVVPPALPDLAKFDCVLAGVDLTLTLADEAGPLAVGRVLFTDEAELESP